MTIYLDNAATTFPKPESVYQATDTFARNHMANPGRGDHRRAQASEKIVNDVRLRLMRIVGAPSPSHCALTFNGTDALNMAIRGVLMAGDHVVTSQLEHNSVLRPLRALEKAGHISLSVVPAAPDGCVDPDDMVKAALRQRTKLVVLTHASNVTGIVQPIAEVGMRVRDSDALFLVDAAQTAGCVPLEMDRMGIDLLAFSGHKGLYGPPGTGALCLGKRAEDVVRPFRVGGTGGQSELPTQPRELPSRLEAGTPNMLGLAGLAAALQFVEEVSVAAIASHEHTLRQRLVTALMALPSCVLYGARLPSVGTLSFNLPEAPSTIAAILDSHFDIAVRAGLHCAPGAHHALGTAPSGTLRVSLSWFNSSGDVDTLVHAISEICADL